MHYCYIMLFIIAAIYVYKYKNMFVCNLPRYLDIYEMNCCT